MADATTGRARMAASASGGAAAGSGIIFQWLERIGLGHVVPVFEERGIHNPQLLMKLEVDDYDAVGVTSGALRSVRVAAASRPRRSRRPATRGARGRRVRAGRVAAVAHHPRPPRTTARTPILSTAPP